jgi:cytochrome c peroxidase
MPTDTSGEQHPDRRHAWPGVIRQLRGNPTIIAEFGEVFGTQPTQHGVAQALATYMRTLLSGGSLYDRAVAEQHKRKATALASEHFGAVLDTKAAQQLAGPSKTVAEAARQLANGWQLFQSKGRCIVCHNGSLFTDHDFHNLGIGDSDSVTNVIGKGEETGRFPHLSVGQKDRRYLGAYKTPSLRNLSATAPYMHNGGMHTLEQVVRYYSKGIDKGLNDFLSPHWHDGDTTLRLHLTDDEARDLVLFLRSLDGGELPAIITRP